MLWVNDGLIFFFQKNNSLRQVYFFILTSLFSWVFPPILGERRQDKKVAKVST